MKDFNLVMHKLNILEQRMDSLEVRIEEMMKSNARLVEELSKEKPSLFSLILAKLGLK